MNLDFNILLNEYQIKVDELMKELLLQKALVKQLQKQLEEVKSQEEIHDS